MKYKRILLIIAVLTICFGCQDSHVTTASELIGIWTTFAPEYGDRKLEVTSNQIKFRSGEQLISIYTITKIKKVHQKGNWELFTVDCEYDDNNEPQKQMISFYYSKDNGGVIKFRNKEGVEWNRKG